MYPDNLSNPVQCKNNLFHKKCKNYLQYKKPPKSANLVSKITLFSAKIWKDLSILKVLRGKNVKLCPVYCDSYGIMDTVCNMQFCSCFLLGLSVHVSEMKHFCSL